MTLLFTIAAIAAAIAVVWLWREHLTDAEKRYWLPRYILAAVAILFPWPIDGLRWLLLAIVIGSVLLDNDKDADL